MAVRADTTDTVPVAGARRLVGPRRAFAPIFEARGMARSMLWIGELAATKSAITSEEIWLM